MRVHPQARPHCSQHSAAGEPTVPEASYRGASVRVERPVSVHEVRSSRRVPEERTRDLLPVSRVWVSVTGSERRERRRSPREQFPDARRSSREYRRRPPRRDDVHHMGASRKGRRELSMRGREQPRQGCGTI